MASGCTLEASGAPSRLQGAPSGLRGAPSGLRGAPSGRRGAPSGLQGAPCFAACPRAVHIPVGYTCLFSRVQPRSKEAEKAYWLEENDVIGVKIFIRGGSKLEWLLVFVC